MGTAASPNIVLDLIDLSSGASDSGETVEIVLEGGAYPGDAIALSEIGVTGKYKKEAAVGVAAVLQGIYHVYVGGTFRNTVTHGYTALQTHIIDVADPHGVAAGQVAIVDSGAYYTGTDVEAALQEVGADLATKAGVADTILTDNSAQSVSSAKPVVTNLNADKVDGAHVGTSAGNLVALDSNGKLPLAQIPDDLAGKNAATVGGKAVGITNGDIPEIGAGANQLNSSVLGKAVGVANTNLPQIDTSAGAAVAGRIHDTVLGKKYPVQARHSKDVAVEKTDDTTVIEHGFFYFQGDGTGNAHPLSVSFPSAFNVAPYVLITPCGSRLVSAGAPAVPADCGPPGAQPIIASVYSILTTGFTSYLQIIGTWSALSNYGFTWMSIGEDTLV